MKMNKSIVTLLVCASGLVAAAVEIDRENGSVSVGKSKREQCTLGNQLEARCKFYTTDFFGVTAVWAGAEVENLTEEERFYVYHVAFFDKDGNLIGSSSQRNMRGKGLEPGKMTTLGSCLLFLPESEIEKIDNYQVVLYEDISEIGGEEE